MYCNLLDIKRIFYSLFFLPEDSMNHFCVFLSVDFKKPSACFLSEFKILDQNNLLAM